jgi:hypothetical protein
MVVESLSHVQFYSSFSIQLTTRQSACLLLHRVAVLYPGFFFHQVSFSALDSSAVVTLLDLLLRLSPLRLDNSEPTSTKAVPSVLAPDGLQHPKFTAQRSNRSVHVVCSRQAISLITKNNKLEHLPSYVTIPPNLANHVSHLLRLRILQELEVFLSQLEAKPKRDIATNPPIRRLTKEEWQNIEERRTIPQQDAVAVITVSPLPPDVEPSMSPFPLALDPDVGLNSSLIVADMYPVSRCSDIPSNFQYRDVLPSTKVPLYDSIALFPHRSQRTVLVRLLSQAQSIYETAQLRRGKLDVSSAYSDAYLLCSNSEIAKLGDMAAVATALWRVYMYERDIVQS